MPARFDLTKAESFIIGESTLAVLIDEPVAVVSERLEDAALRTGQIILRRRDLAQINGVKPRDADPVLRVYEVACEHVAAALLAADPGMAHAVPCRIVVHDAHGITTVSTPRPSMIWPKLSHHPAVAGLAQRAECALQHLLRDLG